MEKEIYEKMRIYCFNEKISMKQFMENAIKNEFRGIE
jgi:hypothetical protein